MKKIATIWMALLLCCFAGLTLAEEAPDLTGDCEITASRKDKLFRLTDGKMKMTFEGLKNKQNWIEVTVPEGEVACGIYIVWKENSAIVSLEAFDAASGAFVPTATLNRGDYVHEFTPLDHLSQFRLVSTDAAGTIPAIEMMVIGEGDTLPSYIQNWQPPCTDADLLLLSAHPDDEYIFFGGAIPWYAVEKEMHVAVAFMTTKDETRLHELLNALWTAGVREYPYLLRFYDKLSEKTRVIYKYWDEEKALDAVASLIDTAKPNVVLTHDFKGEYGHGAHMACADLCLRVIRDGERQTQWPVKKLYLHLWEENPILMEWDVPMKNGTTALAQAQAAFQCHKSQLGYDVKLRSGKVFKFEVKNHGMFDNALFGLAYTTVGVDSVGNDFFENVAPKEVTHGVDLQ